MAKLAHLLAVQGELLSNYLAQNMGEEYAYLILVTPRVPARSVSHFSNIRASHVEPVAFYFGERVKRLDAEALIDPGAPRPIGGYDAAR